MFPADTNLETKFTLESESSGVIEDKPFHILLMGDYSGDSANDSVAAKLKPIEIDRDNFDDVLKKLGVRLRLDFQGNEENVILLEFSELDDFHPDNIFKRLPLFGELRDIRKRLSKADTFDDAAQEVRSWFAKTDIQETNIPGDSDSLTDIDSGNSENLLDQILQDSNSASKPKTKRKSELSNLIEQIVEPHLIRVDKDEQSNLLMIVDEVISDLMRKILHHPDFQALEAAWRGAFFLIRRVETDRELKIFLVNISKENLLTNLKSYSNLADSEVSQLLIKDDNSWAIICGNYSFDLNVDDVAALMRLASIAQMANAPFISHVKPQMFGVTSLDKGFERQEVPADSSEVKLWNAMRSMPESVSLGLAFQRFLVRLPFGEDTEPTENFSFEEFKDSFEHNEFLWANPSFICALLIVQTFSQSGWQIKGNLKQDLENLPVFFYEEDGEKKSKPCAEIALSELSCNTVLEHGIIPLITFRNTDRIRLADLQSISFPNASLKGKWS